MKKKKLIINRQDAVELTGMVNQVVIGLQNQSSDNPNELMLLSILRDCVSPRIAGKLILPALIKSINFKDFEAEALKIAVRNFEISTADAFTISLIERIKTQLR